MDTIEQTTERRRATVTAGARLASVVRQRGSSLVRSRS